MIPSNPMANKAVSLDWCRLIPFAKDPIDISGKINRIEIYENLFSPVLTAKMVVQDDESLTSILPMAGLDAISLQFSVFDFAEGVPVQYGKSSAKLRFMAYSQTHRVPYSFGSEMYTLNLCSAEMYSSAGIKISTWFEDTRAEDIIKTLLDNPQYIGAAGKQFFAQTTNTPLTMVVPYMSPLEVIQLACLMGQSGEETNYLFYETLKGYHFKSIREIVREASKEDIPVLTRGIKGLTDARQTVQTIYVDQIDIVTGYDILALTAGGFFASTTFGLDVLSGRARKVISRANTMPTIVNNRAGYPNYPVELSERINPTARIFVVPTLAISAKDTAITSKDTSVRDNKIESNLDGRVRELMALNSRVVRIKMSGVPNIHAGSLVDVVIPSPNNNNKQIAEYSDMATGRYLVVAVTHNLVAAPTQGFLYETTIEACSDSVT